MTHKTPAWHKHNVACRWVSSINGQRVLHRQAVTFNRKVSVVGQPTPLVFFSFVFFIVQIVCVPLTLFSLILVKQKKISMSCVNNLGHSAVNELNCLRVKNFSALIKLSAEPITFFFIPLCQSKKKFTLSRVNNLGRSSTCQLSAG